MSMTGEDPTYTPSHTPGRVERAALRFVNDPRDTPFLGLIALLLATVVSSGVALYVPGVFRWWLGVLHLGLFGYFLGPFILMLHNTSHRRLFKRSWAWMNHFIPWVMGPFFGESPETYFAHHVGMHHPENNLEADISSTLQYRRDSVVDFARYFFRFFFVGIIELTSYFVARRRFSLMIRCLVGELAFFVFVGALAYVNWRATTVVFILPYFIARFAMMAGNWGQHAFIDRAAPENSYRNSITCINSAYNRRCFNDGYHIGHHVKATRHWTEMPGDFVANLATYEAEGAIVFEGIDFFVVWLLLMRGRYDKLASRVVQLGATSRSQAETEALLRSRVQWMPAAEGERVAA
jgi:fatty acid desaturase